MHRHAKPAPKALDNVQRLANVARVAGHAGLPLPFMGSPLMKAELYAINTAYNDARNERKGWGRS
jgi:hypothetical protein